MTIRYALVKGNLDTIYRYLPSNYTARRYRSQILIEGEDSAGWTLDGYVIPRLASGMHYAREVRACDLEFGEHEHDEVECQRLLDAMSRNGDPYEFERDAYNREAEEQMLGRPLFPNEY